MKTQSLIFRLFLVGLLFGFLATACQKDEAVIPAEEEIAEIATFRQAGFFPKVIALPDGFQPEGIVVGKRADFYVGSLVSGAIYHGNMRTGKGSLLVPPQPPRSAGGLSFDFRTGYLFVSGGLAGNAYVYHGKSGEMLGRVQFVKDPKNMPTMVNDVVVTREAVYFTDSFRPFLYKVSLELGGQLPDPLVFEEIFLSGDFIMTTESPLGYPVNANGIDATPDGKHLVLVNLSLGTLYRVDPETGEALLINIGEESVVFGDGILLDGSKLYVARNMLNMITVIQLSTDMLSGVVQGVITDPLLKIPSTIDNFGQSIYAVNARFDVAPPTGVFPDVEFDVVRLEKW